MMKRTFAVVTALTLGIICSVYGEYSVSNEGLWSKTWPAELEPLRKQAQTYQGPIDQLRYLIPFTDRDQFEAAWPHILKIKGKGTSIILIRGPRTDFFAMKPAGVMVLTPGQREDRAAGKGNERSHQNKIELIVDGDIVDLNRISLPPDTSIIDKRFGDAKTE